MLPIGLYLIYIAALSIVIVLLCMQKLADAVSTLAWPPLPLRTAVRARKIAWYELSLAVVTIVLTVAIAISAIDAAEVELERIAQVYKAYRAHLQR